MIDIFGLGQIGTAIVAVLGAFGAIWAALWGARRSGKKDQQAKDARDALDRIKKGTDAIGRGGDPAERLRRNHGLW